MNKVFLYLSILLILAVSQQSFAGNWTGSGIKITRLASGTDGNLITTNTDLNTTCTWSGTGRIDDASPNLDRILSLALTAYVSGFGVQFYVDGCKGLGAKITDIRITK